MKDKSLSYFNEVIVLYFLQGKEEKRTLAYISYSVQLELYIDKETKMNISLTVYY